MPRANGLMTMQEFSIEIPDKEADAIHSGTMTCNGTTVLHMLISYSNPSRGLHPGPARWYVT